MNNIVKTVLNAVAIAMGIAVIVTSIINPLSFIAVATLLGLGVAALGIANLQK